MVTQVKKKKLTVRVLLACVHMTLGEKKQEEMSNGCCCHIDQVN